MGIFEASWICALSRSFQFNKTDEHFIDRDRVVGARLKLFLSGFADCDDSPAAEFANGRDVFNQLFKRSAQLIFWLTGGSRI